MKNKFIILFLVVVLALTQFRGIISAEFLEESYQLDPIVSYPVESNTDSQEIIVDNSISFNMLEIGGEKMSWEPNEEILYSSTIIKGKKEFSISVVRKETSFAEWMEDRVINGSYVLGKVGFFNARQIKLINKEVLEFDGALFMHDVQGLTSSTLLIDLSDRILVVSYIVREKYNDSFFLAGIASLKVNGKKLLNPALQSILRSELVDHRVTNDKANFESELNSNRLSYINYGNGYKLPWRSGESYYVTQEWGYYFSHTGVDHYAYDFGTGMYNMILASRGGTVASIQSGQYQCGGDAYKNLANFVVINHDDGSSTLYLHLDSIAVSIGQEVSQGDIVGYSGNTGYTFCNAHMHFKRQDYVSNRYDYYKNSREIYFVEYPGVALTNSWLATSQNVPNICGGTNVERSNWIVNGALNCGSYGSFTILPDSSLNPIGGDITIYTM